MTTWTWVAAVVGQSVSDRGVKCQQCGQRENEVQWITPVSAATELTNRSKTYRFILDDLGGYSFTNDAGEVETFMVSEGITVRPSARPLVRLLSVCQFAAL